MARANRRLTNRRKADRRGKRGPRGERGPAGLLAWLEKTGSKSAQSHDAGAHDILPPTGRRIVLFTTESLSLRDANALLQSEGHHGVMRLDEVRTVEKIPTLGTGKTDYKVLRAMIEGK